MSKAGQPPKRRYRGGPGGGAYYGAGHSNAVAGILPKFETSHLSRCEDGPEECLKCKKILADRLHEEQIKYSKLEDNWRKKLNAS